MLSDGEVHRIISALFDKVHSDYRNLDYYDRFSSVLSYLEAIPEARNLSRSEIGLLERVFAMLDIERRIPSKEAVRAIPSASIVHLQ